MGTAERRSGIMKILCRRRCEKIHNLALEFGVSDRTIQRDIEALSLTEPIYTQAGRYGGGVYVADEYYIDQMYMSSEEIILLNKILHIMTEHEDLISKEEKQQLHIMIQKHSKPENT